jgi:hypothetical protein
MTPEERKAEFNKLAPVAINDVAGLIDENFVGFQDYRSQLPVGDPRLLEPALIPADFLTEEGMKQRGLLNEKGEATKLGEDYLLMEDEGFMRGGQLTEKGKAYTADPDELLPVDEVNDWTILTNSFDVNENGKFSDPSVESKYQQFQIRKNEGLDKAEGGNVFKQLGEGLLSFGRGVYNVTPLPTMKKVVTGEGFSPSEEITKRAAVLSGALNIMGDTATKSTAFFGQPILSEDENDRNDFIVATRVKMNRLATEPEALDAITGTSVMADAYAKTLEGYKERFGETGENKLQQDLIDAKVAGQIAGDPLNIPIAIATQGIGLLTNIAKLARVSKSVNIANETSARIARFNAAAPKVAQQLDEATTLNQRLVKQLDDAVKVGDSATVAKLTPAVANSTKVVDDLARKVVGLEEGLAVNTAGRTKALTELADKTKPFDISRKVTAGAVKGVEIAAERLGNAAAFTNRALRAAEKTIGFYGTGRIVTTALGIGTGPVGQTALGTYYTARMGLSVAPTILRKTARFANVVGDELVQMKNSTPFWRRVAANENIGGIGKAMATTLDYASPAARLAVGSVKQGVKLAPALAVYEAINNGGLDDEAMKRVGANALVFGAFARVVGGGKQDLAKRQSGDFYNYRSKQQKLGEEKLAAFDAIPDQPLKQFISTYDSAYPNTWDWQFTREGNSSFDPASKTITVNVNDKSGFVRALTSHETLHSLTFKHGMDDSIVSRMLGDETRPGLVRDINGNLDKDFKQFYDTYNERLDAQGLPRIGIEDAAVEFFTDNGTAALFDDVVSGKLTKAAVKTPLRRKIEDIFETVFAATPIVKDLHYKLGGATDVNGNLVMGSGLLADGMKELPEVKAMVRKMYRESAGLPKSPIKADAMGDIPSSNPKHYKAAEIIDNINKQDVKNGKPLIEGVMTPKNGNGTGRLSYEHAKALEEAGIIPDGGAEQIRFIQEQFEADKAILLENTPIEQGRSVQTAGKTTNKIKPIDFMLKNGRLYLVGMDIVQLGLNIKRFERRAAAMGMSRANVLTDIVETAKLHKRGASTDGYFKSVGGKNWKQRQNFINAVQGLNTKAQRVTNPMFDKLGMDKQTGTYRTFAYDRIDGFTDLTGDMVIPYGNNAYYTLKANLMPQAPRINVKGEIVRDASNVRLAPESPVKKLDSEYIKAIESGDVKSQQKMVDKAAKTLIESFPISSNKNNIPNLESISSSLENYQDFGVRDVPLSLFNGLGKKSYYNASDHAMVDKLMESIRDKGIDSPLIVVIDGHSDGAGYVLEGGHRLAAAEELGLSSLPALVVYDKSANLISPKSSRNVILLSERFAIKNKDTRYMPQGESKAKRTSSLQKTPQTRMLRDNSVATGIAVALGSSGEKRNER